MSTPPSLPTSDHDDLAVEGSGVTADQQAPGADAPALDGVLAKAAHENFPVAAGVLPAQLRADLMAIYGYARFVDDIGDEVDGDRIALLDLVDADVTRLFANESPQLPAVAALRPARQSGWLVEEPLRRLIEANRLDQRVGRYQTFDDLRAYCVLSADPVGRLVLAALRLDTPDRIALSDRVCTGLQLAEHWQDVAEDLRRDRIYLPQDDLRRFGVSEADLQDPQAGPALRSLLAFEVRRARDLLEAGDELVDLVPGRAKLAIIGFVAGGRAALNAIAAVDFDVLTGPPKATTSQRAREVVRLLRPRRRRPGRSEPPRSLPASLATSVDEGRVSGQ